MATSIRLRYGLRWYSSTSIPSLKDLEPIITAMYRFAYRIAFAITASLAFLFATAYVEQLTLTEKYRIMFDAVDGAFTDCLKGTYRAAIVTDNSNIGEIGCFKAEINWSNNSQNGKAH